MFNGIFRKLFYIFSHERERESDDRERQENMKRAQVENRNSILEVLYMRYDRHIRPVPALKRKKRFIA